MASKKKDIQFVISFTDKGTASLKKISRTTKAELDKIGKTTNQVDDDFDKLGKQTETSEKKLTGFQKAMKSTWGQMAIGMGVMQLGTKAFSAISRSIKDTIQQGREFERSWANVRTMLDETTVNQDRMRKSLMQISPLLGESTDLAKGMYQVLSASVEPAKALEVLKVSAMSAKAGVTDTATSVDAITTVLNAYSLEAKQAGSVSDIMFKTVKRGKLTYEQMAGSLGTVVPIAGQVGLGFDQIAGAMASLTKKGIDASTATMQLRQVMVAVLKPSNDAVAMAKKLGIEFTATALKSKGLAKFMSDIQEKTKGDAEAMTLLFGNVRALTGVMGLASNGAKEFTEDVTAMGNASGATQEAFEKQIQSMDYQITAFKTSIQKYKQAFYMGFVENFKVSLEVMKDWEKQVEINTIKAEQSGKALGNVVKTLWKTTKNTLETVQWGISAKVMRQSMNEQAEAIWLTQKAHEQFYNALDAGKSAYTKAKSGISGLIQKYGEYVGAVGVGSLKNVEALKTFEELEMKTKTGLGIELDVLVTQFNTLKNSGMATDGQLDKILKKIVALSAELNTDLSPALQVASGNFKSVYESSKDFDKNLKDMFKDSVKLPSEIQNIADKSSGMAKAVGKDIGKLYDSQVKYSDGFGDWINNQNKYGDTTISNLEKQQKGFKDVEESGLGAYETIANAMSTLGNQIGGIWGDVFSLLGSGLQQFAQNMESTNGDLGKSLGKMSVAIGGIGAKLGEAISGTKSKFGGVGSAIGSGLGSLVGGPIGKALGSLAGGVIGGLFGKKEQLTEEEKKAQKIGYWVDALQTKFSKWGDISEDTAKKISEDVVEKGLKGFIAVSKNFADVIADTGVTQDNMNELFNRTGEIVDHVKGGMLSLEDGTDSLNDSFEQLIDGAKKLDKEGSPAMVDFIKKVRDSGMEIPSMTAYVLEQLDRIPSALNQLIVNAIPESFKLLNEKELSSFGDWLKDFDKEFGKDLKLNPEKMIQTDKFQEKIDGLKNIIGEDLVGSFETWMKQMGKSWLDLSDWLNSGQKKAGEAVEKLSKRLNGFAEITSLSFNAMIENGRSWMDSLNAMKEPINSLIEQYEKLGIAIPESLQPMVEMIELMEKQPKIFENLDSSTQILQALRNSAYMTQDSFNTLAQSATNFAHALLGIKGNLNEALKTMELTEGQIQALLPTVSQFVGTAAMFGLGVPAWMKTFVEKLPGNISFEKFQELSKAQANAGIETVAKLKELKTSNVAWNGEIRKRIGDNVKATNGVTSKLRDVITAIHGINTTNNNTTTAQMGYHGIVTGPKSFRIEPGRREQVDITPVGSGSDKPIVVSANLNVKPVLIPMEDQGGWILNFIQEASEDERLTISQKAIKNAN